MKKIFLITFLLLIVYSQGQTNNSENIVFKVLASYGEVKVQSGEDREWKTLSIGTMLSLNDKLKLSGTSYLGLIHNCGKTIELKKEGEYQIRSLAKDVSTNAIGISQKFANYVLGEIARVDDPSNLSDYKGTMSIAGSVERAALNVIFLYMPRNTNLNENTVTFTWYQIKNPDRYKFTLVDKNAKLLFEQETQDTSVTVDLQKLSIERGECFYWSVHKSYYPELKSTEDYCITLLPEQSIAAIRDTLNLIRKELGNEDMAAAKLVLASYYESNRLYMNADKAYQQAIELEPQVEAYRKAYAMFLMSQGLKEKAKSVLNK